MTGIRYGGLQIRGIGGWAKPVADLYCIACGHHKRVTGDAKVIAFLRTQPLNDHRARCPANSP